MPNGLSSHVTYDTPAWWAVERLEGHYWNAESTLTTLPSKHKHNRLSLTVFSPCPF